MRRRFLPRIAPALLICICSAGAHAQTFFSVEYESIKRRASGLSVMSTGATVGYKAASGNEYSFKAAYTQPTPSHGEHTEAVEVAAKTYFIDTERIATYATLGIGERFKAAGHFGYTFLSTGIKLHTTRMSLIDLGTTWTSLGDVDRTYYLTRLYASFSYGLTEYDWISLRASRVVGVAAIEQDALRLMYTRFF